MSEGRRWSTRRKLLLQVCLLPILALALELGVRVFYLARGNPWDGDAARARFEQLANLSASDLPRPPGMAIGIQRKNRTPHSLHPFVAFEDQIGHRSTGEHYELFRIGLPENAYSILIVGGSVAGLFGQRETGALDVLARSITADPRFEGRELVFLAHGRGSFKQPQQLLLVAYLISIGVVPDAVICLDGFNEVALSNQNLAYFAHPLAPSFRQWSLVSGEGFGGQDPALMYETWELRRRIQDAARAALVGGYHHSAILGRRALSRLAALSSAYTRAEARFLSPEREDNAWRGLRALSFEGDQEEAIELAIGAWSRASRSLAALCEGRGIGYLQVLQPTLHDAGAKPVTEEELETGRIVPAWKRGVEHGYPLLRAEGARLREQGVAFHDASGIFRDVPETLYYDSCHFGRRGNELLAIEIGAAFLASLQD